MKTKFYLLVANVVLLLTGCASNEPMKQAEYYLNRSFKWEVKTSVEHGETYNQTITIGSDTFINGKTYRLVDNYFPMRQDNYAIYMYDRNNKEEVLLYDFSLKVGDSIEQLEDRFMGIPARYAKVSKTEMITLADGRKARRIEYEQTYPGPRNPDVEFVGNERRGILGPLDNMLHESQLIAFYDNTILLYPNPISKECDGEMQRFNNIEEPTDTYDCLKFLDNYGSDFQTAYEKLQPEIDDFVQELKQQHQYNQFVDTSRTEVRLTKRNVRNSPKENAEYTSVDVYMLHLYPTYGYIRMRVFRVIDSDGDVYTVNY